MNQSDINIYLIQRKILSILTAAVKKTAAKTDAKSKSKSKLNYEYQITHDVKSADNIKL